MSFRRTLASMLVPLAALSISGSHVTAQVGNRGASLLVPNANATQPAVVGSQTPGVTTAPPQPETGTPPAAQTSLGSLLCSVDRFRDVSSPGNVAQQLNAILAAFGATAGS